MDWTIVLWILLAVVVAAAIIYVTGAVWTAYVFVKLLGDIFFRRQK